MIKSLLLAGMVVSVSSSAATPVSWATLPPTPQLIVQGPLPSMEAIYTWSADSSILASLSALTGRLQLWDTTSGNTIYTHSFGVLEDKTVFSADFSLSQDRQSFILWLEPRTGECLGRVVAIFTKVPTEARMPPPALGKPCTHWSERRLPSPAGYRLVATDHGETIVAPGKPPVRLAASAARDLVDVDVTLAGTRAVLLANQRATMLDAVAGSVAEVWSLDRDTRVASLRVPGAYATARWLDGDRFMLTGFPDRGVKPQPTLIVDGATGRILDSAPFRCAVAAYGKSGAMIAGRTSRCLDADDQGLDPGLRVRRPHGAWQLAHVEGLGTPLVEAVAASQDASAAAILTRRTIRFEHPGAADQGKLLIDQMRLVVITGDLLGTTARARTVPVNWLSDGEGVQSIHFTPDGTRVVIDTYHRIIVVGLADGHETTLQRAGTDQARVITVGNEAAITASYRHNKAESYPLDGSKASPPMFAESSVMSAGFLANGLRWAATFDGSIGFYSRDGSQTLELSSLGAAGFVAVDSSGRYDSSLGPDSNAFRWWFPDEPLRSLGGQTFMRDYLEPQLLTKTLACIAAGNCATALPAPPPVGRLNRTLPDVRIARVRPGPRGDTAIVEVEARSIERHAANGKTRSGMFNLRLFRGRKLVGQWPAASSDTAALDLDGWRRTNALRPGMDGVFRASITVRLPTALTARHSEFQAYAFNDDRVTSDAARASYDRPLVWPRTPTAFVLTIGIDDYAEDRFHLDYAVADADLLAKRLAKVPRYRIRRLDLRGKGAKRQATTQSIADAIALLAPGDHAAARARLRALGVDPSVFTTATPDDLVLITFAGHGWADPRGNFYLVPADESWPEGQDLPDLKRLISAAELSDWLRPIDAGDASIIIDACNSAAVVASAGFKPGPLGDRGLGQLAYDKGILILAASQTDQKAHEDRRLGHGFLTAALARDGLDEDGFGRADLNDDGQITLDEWLRYAVARLPALSAEVAGAARGRDFMPIADTASRAEEAPVAPQQPSLFDFAAGQSPVVLAREPWPAGIRRLEYAISGWSRAASYSLTDAWHVVTDTLYGVLIALAPLIGLAAFLLGRWLWRVVRRHVHRAPN